LPFLNEEDIKVKKSMDEEVNVLYLFIQ